MCGEGNTISTQLELLKSCSCVPAGFSSVYFSNFCTIDVVSGKGTSLCIPETVITQMYQLAFDLQPIRDTET